MKASIREVRSFSKMQKLLTAAVVFITCDLVIGHRLFANRCLNSLGKYPFDEQKFSGDWYSVANAIRPKKHSEELKCDKIHYTAEMVGNVTRVHMDVNLKFDGDSEKTLEVKGQGIRPGMASSIIAAVKHEDKWHDTIKHSVLATDYETYAIVHGCKEKYDEKTDAFIKVVIDQVWSRNPTLDDATVKILKSVMSSLDIPEDEWVDVDNSAC